MMTLIRQAGTPPVRIGVDPAPCRVAMAAFRKAVQPALLISVLALEGCNTFKPPQISYDEDVPRLPAPPAPADDRPRPLHIPPVWTPARGGKDRHGRGKGAGRASRERE